MIPVKLVSYLMPMAVGFCITGIIWEVREQSSQDERIRAIIENQKWVISHLEILTNDVYKKETPLSKQVDMIQSKLDTNGDRLLRIESKVDTLEKK